METIFRFMTCPQCGYQNCGSREFANGLHWSLFCFSCGFYNQVDVVYEQKIAERENTDSEFKADYTGGVRLEAFSYQGMGVCITKNRTGICIDRVPSALSYKEAKVILQDIYEKNKREKCCITLWDGYNDKVEMIGGALFENWELDKGFRVSNESVDEWEMTFAKHKEYKVNGLGKFLDEFYHRLDFAKKTMNSEKPTYQDFGNESFDSIHSIMIKNNTKLFRLVTNYVHAFQPEITHIYYPIPW